MSTEYDLHCRQCNKHIWIGTDNMSGQYFFSGHPDVMEMLRLFLFEHAGHELVFEQDHLHEDSEDVDPEFQRWENAKAP